MKNRRRDTDKSLPSETEQKLTKSFGSQTKISRSRQRNQDLDFTIDDDCHNFDGVRNSGTATPAESSISFNPSMQISIKKKTMVA